MLFYKTKNNIRVMKERNTTWGRIRYPPKQTNGEEKRSQRPKNTANLQL